MQWTFYRTHLWRVDLGEFVCVCVCVCVCVSVVGGLGCEDCLTAAIVYVLG